MEQGRKYPVVCGGGDTGGVWNYKKYIGENAGGVDTEFSVFMLYLASAAIRKRDQSRSLFFGV